MEQARSDEEGRTERARSGMYHDGRRANVVLDRFLNVWNLPERINPLVASGRGEERTLSFVPSSKTCSRVPQILLKITAR